MARIQGTNNDDRIYGDDGNNVIVGKAGADFQVGGGGRDTFKFNKLNDFAVRDQADAGGWDTVDFVADFQVGIDKIDLRGIDANQNAGGNQAFKFIGDDDFSRQAGELRVDANGHVTADVDGDGESDLYLLVREGWYDTDINLTANDFVL